MSEERTEVYSGLAPAGWLALPYAIAHGLDSFIGVDVPAVIPMLLVVPYLVGLAWGAVVLFRWFKAARSRKVEQSR